MGTLQTFQTIDSSGFPIWTDRHIDGEHKLVRAGNGRWEGDVHIVTY